MPRTGGTQGHLEKHAARLVHERILVVWGPFWSPEPPESKFGLVHDRGMVRYVANKYRGILI